MIVEMPSTRGVRYSTGQARMARLPCSTSAELASSFHHKALFIGPNARKAVNEGRAEYIPAFLSDVPDLFRSGILPLDAVLINVTPPDEHGFCSLGTSVVAMLAAIPAATTVIAQLNTAVPRTLGESFVHVDDMNHHHVLLPFGEVPIAREIIVRYVRRSSNLHDTRESFQFLFQQTALELWVVSDKRNTEDVLLLESEIFFLYVLQLAADNQRAHDEGDRDGELQDNESASHHTPPAKTPRLQRCNGLQ